MARRLGADRHAARRSCCCGPTTSAVWICRDEAGALYYHANRGGGRATWIEDQTALFLPDVRRDGDGYVVTAARRHHLLGHRGPAVHRAQGRPRGDPAGGPS